MRIYRVSENKEQYMDLLLLADEQADMIERYLSRGTMYVLDEGGVQAACVVTDEGDGVLELKSLAVRPERQRRGYATALIDFLAAQYRGQYSVLTVGTGDVPWIIRFYERCGFVRSGVVANFFTEHYDHAMFDAGIQLVDMIYLSREL